MAEIPVLGVLYLNNHDFFIFNILSHYLIYIFRPGWLTIGPDLSNSNYDWGLHQVFSLQHIES